MATWASASPGVATISAAGLAHGASQGESTISATLGAVSGNTLLTVGPPTLTSIAVTPTNPTIANGTTSSSRPPADYSDGSTADLTSSATWGSASPAVATINAGWLPRREPGHEQKQCDARSSERQHPAHRRQARPGPDRHR